MQRGPSPEQAHTELHHRPEALPDGRAEGGKPQGRFELRKQRVDKRNSNLMQGFDMDESSDKTVAEQLRDALSKHGLRVVDLFRSWDDDGSGDISKREFRRGLREMQFDAPAAAMDELFDAWDPDGSGKLELKELEKQLRRGSQFRGQEFTAVRARR